MSVQVPKPGPFIFRDHLYSNNGSTVLVHDMADLTAPPVSRLSLTDQAMRMLFRYANGSAYAWAVCRNIGAVCYDVTDPVNPKPLAAGTVRPTASWTMIGAAIDQDTGQMYVEESRGMGTMERRIIRYRLTEPGVTPIFDGMTILGMSQSGRGGLFAFLGEVGGRRLVAVTYSGEYTAIIDTTASPFVVSRSGIPCLQAMDSRGGHLYGHDGDPIFNARERALGVRRMQMAAVASRWSTYAGLDGPSPTRIATMEAPGFWYDQDPNLRVIVRDDRRFVLSGWTDGKLGEYVSVLEVNATTGAWKPVGLPLTMPLGIEPVLVEITGPSTALWWGFPPYNNGWRYFAVPMTGLPYAPAMVDAVELHV